MATLDPFKNVRMFLCPGSELNISFSANNKIKDPTAIILYVITSDVTTVVVVVVTVDIINLILFHYI